MSQRNLKMTVAHILLSFLVFGCSHVNYVGKSYEPTSHVDVFYSEEEISKEYTVIGHAIGAGQIFVSTNKIQRNLIKKARSQGADAILITDIDRDNELDGRGFDAEKQINALFLKYQ